MKGIKKTVKMLKVLALAEKAVAIPYVYGHSDVGDSLVRMLKGETTPKEAAKEIDLLIEGYRQ